MTLLITPFTYQRHIHFYFAYFTTFDFADSFPYIHNAFTAWALYNASVNVPFGLAYYDGKLFVALPRRNPGIPSTLNIVVLNGDPPHLNPLLTAYPNYQMTALDVRRANISPSSLELESNV